MIGVGMTDTESAYTIATVILNRGAVKLAKVIVS